MLRGHVDGFVGEVGGTVEFLLGGEGLVGLWCGGGMCEGGSLEEEQESILRRGRRDGAL